MFEMKKYVEFLNPSDSSEEKFLLKKLEIIAEQISTMFFDNITVIRSEMGNYRIYLNFWKDELDYRGEHCTPQYILCSVYIPKKDMHNSGINKAIYRLEKKLNKYKFWSNEDNISEIPIEEESPDDFEFPF